MKQHASNFSTHCLLLLFSWKQTQPKLKQPKCEVIISTGNKANSHLTSNQSKKRGTIMR